jgi:ribosome-binding factor A
VVDHARARRLGERIKVLAAEALVEVVKDPDLGFVTITDVRVTPDLTQARLFYTVLGGPEELEQSKEILERNKGKLRGAIGRQLGIRVTPTLELVHDEMPASAGALADLQLRPSAGIKRLSSFLKTLNRPEMPTPTSSLKTWRTSGRVSGADR